MKAGAGRVMVEEWRTGCGEDGLGREELEDRRIGRHGSESHRRSEGVEVERRGFCSGGACLSDMVSSSLATFSGILSAGLENGNRGFLLSSKGDTVESELSLDGARCHENGRRGGGMGGGILPTLGADRRENSSGVSFW